MTKTKKIIIIAVAAFIVFVLALSFVLAWSGVLAKPLDEEGTAFRILQITDAHIQLNEREDAAAFDTIRRMIERTAPDLIVVTGDITSGYYKDQTQNEECFRKFAQEIEKYEIPWTFTFGNHDAEGVWKRADIDAYLTSSKLEYCVYETGFVASKESEEQQESYGNYYLNITSDGRMLTANEPLENAVMTLFFMDSNDYEYDENGEGLGYGNFRDSQIEWYKNCVNGIAEENGGEVLPSLAFFHIPMQEYETAWSEGERLYGYKLEGAGSPAVDDEMFETMAELGSTKATFAGHDHMNAFATEYQGIKLVYGYSCDHGIYMVPQNGGTVINIKSDGEFTIQGIYRNSGVGELIISSPV